MRVVQSASKPQRECSGCCLYVAQQLPPTPSERLQARGRARDLGLFADIGAGILGPASVARGVPDGVAAVELDDVDDKLDACLVSRADGRSPAVAACTEAPARPVLVGDIPLRLAGRARASDRR